MRSVVLFTDEIDDLDLAIGELKQQFQQAQGKLLAHSGGLVMAHQDTDFKELSARLKEELGIPLVGCTAMSLFTMQGYKTEGISVHIFTADDVKFAVGISGEVNQDNMQLAMRRMYVDVTADMFPEDIKLILAYGTRVDGLMGDDFIEALDDLSGGVPVFGGCASDNFEHKECKVFAEDKVVENGMAIMVLSGNLQPVSLCQLTLANMITYEGKVTELNGNMVMKVNGVPLKTAVQEAGININEETDFGDYAGTPFKIAITTPEGDEYEVMRHLYTMDLESGGGTFLGRVPLGAKMHIGMIGKGDIHDSVAGTIRTALQKVISEQNYKFSTALVISCASRLISYSTDVSTEVQDYVNLIPDGIGMSGFYSFGEICPSKSKNSDRKRNTFHNTTFTMLLM